MAEPSYDRTGAARQALQEIYRDYGLSGVDNEALLNQLLPDLLAGSPRETSLLRTAASAGVGSMLTTRINGGMAPDAAVRDVAAVLTERSAFDPTACIWVVSEFATALGHPVSVGLTTGNIPVVPTTGAPVNTDAQPTTMDNGPTPAPQQPVPQPGPAPYPPPYTGPQTGPQPIPAPYPNPYSGPAPMPAPMPMPYPGPVKKKSSTGLIIGIVVGVVVLVCIAGVVLYAIGSSSKCSGSSCTPTTKHSTHPPVVPSTTPPVTTPPPVTNALDGLIPGDLDPNNDCTPHGDATPAGFSGLVDQLDCVESSNSTIEDGSVDIYKFSSVSTLHASYAALNTDYDFRPGDAGTKCPPASGVDGGDTKWNHRNAPNTTVGTVECYSTKDSNHIYIWSNEPELTITVAAVDSTISFASLEAWWEGTGCCRTT